MIEHIWSVLCVGSSIDKDSNNISVFDSFEEIQVAAKSDDKIVLGISYQVVTLWMRSDLAKPEKSNCRIVLRHPDGTELQPPTPYLVDLSHHERLRHRANISGLPVQGSGLYRFVIEVQDETSEWFAVARVPLKITVTESIQDS